MDKLQVKEEKLEELVDKYGIKLTQFDERCGYVFDDNEDFLEKKGNPKTLTAYFNPDADIIIATAIIDGTYKNGYMEYDLILRYRPSHFSWNGCYNHYFLNGKFTGDIRRTKTKTMYSKELKDTQERMVGAQLFDSQINRFKPLIKVLELTLDKKLLDESELEEIQR